VDHWVCRYCGQLDGERTPEGLCIVCGSLGVRDLDTLRLYRVIGRISTARVRFSGDWQAVGLEAHGLAVELLQDMGILSAGRR
jgi:hypothetical protein